MQEYGSCKKCSSSTFRTVKKEENLISLRGDKIHKISEQLLSFGIIRFRSRRHYYDVCDNFYDETVLIFFVNTVVLQCFAMVLIKILIEELHFLQLPYSCMKFDVDKKNFDVDKKNGVDKNFQHHFTTNMVIASQKLVSQILLSYNSLHNQGCRNVGRKKGGAAFSKSTFSTVRRVTTTNMLSNTVKQLNTSTKPEY